MYDMMRRSVLSQDLDVGVSESLHDIRSSHDTTEKEGSARTGAVTVYRAG